MKHSRRLGEDHVIESRVCKWPVPCNMFPIWLILVCLMGVLWFWGNLLKSNMPLNQIYKCLCILWETPWDGPMLVRKCMRVSLYITVYFLTLIFSLWRSSSKQRRQRKSIGTYTHFGECIQFETCLKKLIKQSGKRIKYWLEWKNTWFGNISFIPMQEETFPNVSMQSVSLKQFIPVFLFALLTYSAKYHSSDIFGGCLVFVWKRKITYPDKDFWNTKTHSLILL